MESELQQAIQVVIRELKNDSDYYYCWQSNIAMAFYDEVQKHSETGVYNFHNIANDAARAFLNQLISTSEPEQETEQ